MKKTKKAFKEFLNAKYADQDNYQGRNTATKRNMGQKTQGYGDYLYQADRAQFDVYYQDWLNDQFEA